MRPAVGMALALALLSCGRGSDVPVPREVAYPRVVEYDTAYVAVDSLPVKIYVNKDAVVARPRPGWIDVVYTEYSATVHITVTPVADVGGREAAMLNRMERMALNVGTAALVRERFVSDGGLEGVVLVAGEPVSTPVQFVAADDRYVVSGAAFFSGWTPATSADSVAPMVGVVGRDMERMVKALE